ncbi:PAS domain-containing protein, partial [Methylobacterium sp. WL103]
VSAFQAVVGDRRLSALDAENRRSGAATRQGGVDATDATLQERIDFGLQEPIVVPERRVDADGSYANPRPADPLDRHVLWTATDVVMVLDRDGRLLRVSENGSALLGASTAECVGRPWIDAWSLPESRAGIRNALDAARAGRPCRVQA